MGSAYINEPYKLYRDGALVDQGMTDANGYIKAKHPEGTGHYMIELATGEKFDLPVEAKFAKDDAAKAQQKLALQGHGEIPGLDHLPDTGLGLFDNL
jgi:type VI secretion system secreted protein VgrG